MGSSLYTTTKHGGVLLQAAFTRPFCQHHRPIDIVGHCHEHQCPTNPSEDYDSTLVQHFGFWYSTSPQPEKKYILKKKQRRGLQKSEDSYRLPCFVAIIIPQKEGGDYDDDSRNTSRSQNLLEELPNQHKTLPGTKYCP